MLLALTRVYGGEDKAEEVQRIELAKDFDDYQGRAFIKFSIRGWLFQSGELGTLVCHCSHDERLESPIVSLIVVLYSA